MQGRDIIDMSDIKYESSRKALLVIDMQEDYTGVTAKPPFPYKESANLIKTINRLTEEATNKNIITVYIRQEFEGFIGKIFSKVVGHGTAIKGNQGAELDKRINIVSDFCFSKRMPDAFTNPKLNKFLKEHQVNKLYLVGLDAAGCVYYTAKGAIKRGYNVLLLKMALFCLLKANGIIL